MDGQEKRTLPPLEQDEVPVFFALDMVGRVPMEGLVMGQRVRPVGIPEERGVQM
jgi:hypothetical protein